VPTTERHVVVVGAGAGGLCAAIDLARQGLRVTLLEAADTPGGKLHQRQVDGVGIDSGPTVFTMRWVFDSLFEAAGTRLEDHLQLEQLTILARHAWAGGGQFDLHANPQASAEAIGRFSGAAEARRFLAFCDQARKVYDTLEGPYIRSTRPDAASLTRAIGLGGTLMLSSLGPFRDLWRALAKHFHDPRLQQLFGRYATYCGSSPFEAPATLMLVAHVEMLGVWALQGGMIALAQALSALAQRLGVTLRCGARVTGLQLKNGRVCSVTLHNGEQIEADEVIFNGDVNALAQGLLGTSARSALPAVPLSDRSQSAVTWSVRTKASGFGLVRHNVFFDDDYASEFKDIFGHRRLPRQPTVYLCAQDRNDAGQAPTPERMLLLVNAPPLGDRPSDALSEPELLACERRVSGLLQRCGLQIEGWQEEVQAEARGRIVRSTPMDFEQRFPATGGALYGRASHGWMSAFARPDASTDIEGLYVAGGSVHPGPGVPMAALSGRLAAATLMAHLRQGRRRVRLTLPRR
jgi:1-hydroxycarotenoid 3,4-desaturase